MPKVKLIFINDHYSDECSQSIVRFGTDWEEITNEERDLLRRNLHHVPRPAGLFAHLIEQDFMPIQERIESLRWVIADIAAKNDVERKKREAIKKNRAAAKLAKTAQTKKDKEALLSTLAAELGVTVIPAQPSKTYVQSSEDFENKGKFRK
jgi:hypothetical protein